MGKIRIERIAEMHGNPTYKLSCYNLDSTEPGTDHTVYCPDTTIDGHWLIRVGGSRSAMGTKRFDPRADVVIGVVDRKGEIPRKVLESARIYAKSLGIGSMWDIEDLTLEESPVRR